MSRSGKEHEAATNAVPPDPLIDEVREIRRMISEQFGNDVDRLCDYLQELEREHPERIARSRSTLGNTAKP